MLYEVIETLETEASDVSTGVNARIATVNSEKSLSGSDALPTITTIYVWGATDGVEPKLPAEFAEAELPALVLRVARSTGAYANQGKRRGTHDVEFYYLDHEPDPRRAKKFIALMQKVLVRWIEGLLGSGTIANAEEPVFEPRRFVTAGRGESIDRAVLSVRLIERDENP